MVSPVNTPSSWKLLASDTVKELRNRKAENLTKKMNEVNEEKKLTRKVPVESVVAGWIEASKSLEPRIAH